MTVNSWWLGLLVAVQLRQLLSCLLLHTRRLISSIRLHEHEMSPSKFTFYLHYFGLVVSSVLLYIFEQTILLVGMLTFRPSLMI